MFQVMHEFKDCPPKPREQMPSSMPMERTIIFVVWKVVTCGGNMCVNFAKELLSTDIHYCHVLNTTRLQTLGQLNLKFISDN